MPTAKELSDAIRMKRKKLKAGGVAEMVDTAPGPQMNAQDVYNNKQTAQMRETMDIPDPHEGPSDPADNTLDDTQKTSALKKKMAMIARILGTLSVG